MPLGNPLGYSASPRQTRFSLQSSNSFGQGRLRSFTTERVRPEVIAAADEQRRLGLESQRQGIAQQKQKSRLLEQLLGGAASGGGAGGLMQPGFRDDGVGIGGGQGGGYGGLLDSVLGDLAGVGNSQRANINQGFDQALNNQLAMFSDRGLLSSNLAGNAFTGNERARQGSLMDLEDSLLQRRAGARQQIGLAGLQQQQNLLMQLLQQLG